MCLAWLQDILLVKPLFLRVVISSCLLKDTQASGAQLSVYAEPHQLRYETNRALAQLEDEPKAFYREIYKRSIPIFNASCNS